jgi:hypothetical protein
MQFARFIQELYQTRRGSAIPGVFASALSAARTRRD